MKPGSEVVIEIDGIGRLVNRYEARPAAVALAPVVAVATATATALATAAADAARRPESLTAGV
jgi:hypothetical protein